MKFIIFGADGVGKTTFAHNLAKYLEGDTVIRSYADPVKDLAHKHMGREPKNREDKEENFRQLYMDIGEKAKELYGDDYWAKKMVYEQGDVDNIIIDDARFMCELEESLKYDFIPIFLVETLEPMQNGQDLLGNYDLVDIYTDYRVWVCFEKVPFDFKTVAERINDSYPGTFVVSKSVWKETLLGCTLLILILIGIVTVLTNVIKML